MVAYTKEQALINLKGLILKYNENKSDKGFTSNESQISESLIKPFVNLVLGYDTSDPSELRFKVAWVAKEVICLSA